MPRMNSSSSYTSISQEDFPRDCASLPGAYSVRYHYELRFGDIIDVRVCMPADVSKTPWKQTRNRQDISETMFINIGIGLQNINIKYVVNSTLGYFELPNYGNNGIAGPLLADDPFDSCLRPGSSQSQCTKLVLRRRSLQIDEGAANHAVGHKQGPLTMVTAALFSPGSFLEIQLSKNRTQPPAASEASEDGPCIFAPLAQLMSDNNPWCGTLYSYPSEYLTVTSQSWLNYFKIDDKIENALHAAVILASQMLFSDGPSGRLDVEYDRGIDSVRPKISTTGVIVVSILLGADLFLLLALATYISFSHTWTSSFDAETMMRLGAARAAELPLQVLSSVKQGKDQSVLERIPGWVGDARAKDELGVLAVGASDPLKRGRKYHRQYDGTMQGKQLVPKKTINAVVVVPFPRQ